MPEKASWFRPMFGRHEARAKQQALRVPDIGTEQTTIRTVIAGLPADAGELQAAEKDVPLEWNVGRVRPPGP